MSIQCHFGRSVTWGEQPLFMKWLIYKGFRATNYCRYTMKVSFFRVSEQKEGALPPGLMLLNVLRKGENFRDP